MTPINGKDKGDNKAPKNDKFVDQIEDESDLGMKPSEPEPDKEKTQKKPPKKKKKGKAD